MYRNDAKTFLLAIPQADYYTKNKAVSYIFHCFWRDKPLDWTNDFNVTLPLMCFQTDLILKWEVTEHKVGCTAKNIWPRINCPAKMILN